MAEHQNKDRDKMSKCMMINIFVIYVMILAFYIDMKVTNNTTDNSLLEKLKS